MLHDYPFLSLCTLYHNLPSFFHFPALWLAVLKAHDDVLSEHSAPAHSMYISGEVLELTALFNYAMEDPKKSHGGTEEKAKPWRQSKQLFLNKDVQQCFRNHSTEAACTVMLVSGQFCKHSQNTFIIHNNPVLNTSPVLGSEFTNMSNTKPSHGYFKTLYRRKICFHPSSKYYRSVGWKNSFRLRKAGRKQF